MITAAIRELFIKHKPLCGNAASQKLLISVGIFSPGNTRVYKAIKAQLWCRSPEKKRKKNDIDDEIKADIFSREDGLQPAEGTKYETKAVQRASVHFMSL